ncbi:MAG TPA: serine/threonine protein phosphatase [Actinoplanes sp.]|nr:serine/threonine protein phosphatase [Actinoplanes sp.]
MPDLAQRCSRHDRVAALLAACSDGQLATPSTTVGVGGGSSVLDVDGVPVFVKRIPITGRELASPHGTANLFGLPAHWQYGMYRLPGPGFNTWRELAANQIVTDGVLAGETAAFPLLHHWRILPGRPPAAAEHHDLEPVIAQFGGHPAVRARFEALAGASASLVLFLEHLPELLPEWLADPIGRAEAVERQLFEITAFLRDRELLHLDGHFGNIRADSDRLYLVDFGLATSPRFDLSPAERDFAAHNLGHDADYAAMRLVNWLVSTACGIPFPARDQFVRRCATGDLDPDVPQHLSRIITRHAPAAARMNTFCTRLHDGDLDAGYPGSPLTR